MICLVRFANEGGEGGHGGTGGGGHKARHFAGRLDVSANIQSFRLAINYNGRWDDLDYVDEELIGEWVENKLSYNELMEMTYRLTEIDRTPSRWILPCVDQYSFGTTPAASTSQEGPLFVGQVFEDKHKLKIELGLYAMHERFDIIVRRSIKYRFEADCKDINCQFTIGAVRNEHCTFWHVKKFIKTHTCEGDMYGGQFQAASANVIGQLYTPKLSSGANICPKDIMRDMREKHGVELLNTKAWMAMQHARSTVYVKVDESYQFLPGYFHMLAEANPGTVTAIEMDKHNRFLYAFHSFRKSLQEPKCVINICLTFPIFIGVPLTILYVERWSLVYCPEKRYGFMTIIIVEEINSTAKEARKLSITTLVEFLRDLMQKWFHDRRKAANKGSSILTDFSLEHVKSNHEKSQLCVVQPIDYSKYAMKDNEGKVWTVDLELRTCTCRKFDLDMLPCAHAIVVCRHTRVPKERLSSDYFTTQWFQTAYAPSIHPVPHPSSWVLPERVSSCVVHPPKGRRQSGRPKKIRIRSSLEGPETRVCTNCGESGHNRITCTKPRQERSISKSSSSSIGKKPPFRRQRACGRYGLLGHNIKTCSNLEAKP
ncbi:hypothetical protein Ddye_010831 [Dipteronia dyeriana]|uniref:SWIM-type domain-containing protein n=1 Tax=Dipteronia dyeriana TaxID=168575 RepID=A0AAD9XE42_9ROSI|nr:hypothetical protein Ddye_010831 [Dipteronia dyeriana]